MADPYKRDRSQDEYSEADYKRLRMISGPLGTGSSPQRERESSDRNLEQRRWEDRGGDSPPSSNSLCSDIMKRLHPVPSELSGNWCNNHHNFYPKFCFVSQSFLQRIRQNDQQDLWAAVSWADLLSDRLKRLLARALSRISKQSSRKLKVPCLSCNIKSGNSILLEGPQVQAIWLTSTTLRVQAL